MLAYTHLMMPMTYILKSSLRVIGSAEKHSLKGFFAYIEVDVPV